MRDLNDLLLFIAVVTPVVVLARTWRAAALNRGLRIAAVAVLSICAGAWAFAPRVAGFVGGGAWLLLLFLPAAALRRAAKLSAQHRFGAAAQLLDLLTPLQPSRALREQARLLRAIAVAQRGERVASLATLDELARGKSHLSRQAEAQRFRIAGEWEGLLAWSTRNLPPVGVGDDPTLLPLYFRALGELGFRDELVVQFAGRAHALLGSLNHQRVYLESLAVLFAFCGRSAALTNLFANQLRHLPDDLQEFWLATSEAAAGEFAASRMRLERLRASTSDALLRGDADQRLARRGQLPPLPLSAASEASVARVERTAADPASGWDSSQKIKTTPAVSTLIALNLLMFAVEMLLGGSTNTDTLKSLGGLEPIAVFFGGQYWRMIAALFLHYGPIHLLFNLYALYVLGPALEQWIGTARFTIAYLLSGIGSSAGVLLLWRIGLTQADLLVGASGSIMGIVGSWAGVLLAHRRAPVARQRLMNIAFIVVLQTAFDFYTPQVSMAAHLSGFASGFVIGIFVRPKDAP
ncbi:MAG: rhomboid family intramembrane serine protease [Verrucomicrobiota bacterium]|nr:rhomboid family intramembrane serine protease [Verrucomicrobiota bacterium]